MNRPGRKKISNNSLKKIRSIRFSDDEIIYLNELKSKLGYKTLSSLIHASLFKIEQSPENSFIKFTNLDLEIIRKYIFEINKIGNNINQISKNLNKLFRDFSYYSQEIDLGSLLLNLKGNLKCINDINVVFKNMIKV